MLERAIFVSSAAMDPDLARRLANRLEAMVGSISMHRSRRRLRAEGTPTVIASGSPAAHTQAMPALSAMAAKIYGLGEKPGQAATFK
jgi:putative dehydrogenase